MCLNVALWRTFRIARRFLNSSIVDQFPQFGISLNILRIISTLYIQNLWLLLPFWFFLTNARTVRSFISFSSSAPAFKNGRRLFGRYVIAFLISLYRIIRSLIIGSKYAFHCQGCCSSRYPRFQHRLARWSVSMGYLSGSPIVSTIFLAYKTWIPVGTGFKTFGFAVPLPLFLFICCINPLF